MNGHSSTVRSCDNISCALGPRDIARFRVSSENSIALHRRVCSGATGLPCVRATGQPADAYRCRRRTAERTPTPPTPGNAAQAHPDPDQAIVVTGVKRTAGDMLRRRIGDRRGGAEPRDPAQHRRNAEETSRGHRIELRPDCVATDPARTSGRARARAGRRHRQPRPVVVRPGPRGRRSTRSPPSGSKSCAVRRRCCSDRPRSAASSMSSTRGFRAALPDEPVEANALAATAPQPTSGRAISRSTFRSAQHFVAHADGAYSKYRRPPDRRLSAVARPAGQRRWPARTRRSARWPTSRVSSRTRRAGSTDFAGGLAYVDGDLNIGLSVDHHDAQAMECRSASRSIRTSKPKRRPSTATRPAAMSASTSRSVTALQDCSSSAAGSPNTATTRLRRMARSVHASSPTGANYAPTSSRTIAAAGAARAASNIYRKRRHLVGEEKYLPDSRIRQTGLFTLQSLALGKARFEAGARVEFARLKLTDAVSPRSPKVRRSAWRHRVGDHAISAAASHRSRARSAPTTSSLPGWRAGLSLSHSERAPAIDELFSHKARTAAASRSCSATRSRQGKEQLGSSLASTT